MSKRLLKYIYIAVFLFFGLLFIARFGRSAILKAYVQTGIGNCQTSPILCAIPGEEIINPEIDNAYLAQLLPHIFSDIEISLPRGFTVTKEKITKVYYKKRKQREKSSAIYLLYEKPKFFPNLFPQLQKQGIGNNYEFLKRTMDAQFVNIDNLTDTFFVIMKSIFTPNLGDQKNLVMVKFKETNKRGFINYNLAPLENYFDCNIISVEDSFVKIYIKDKGATLDLGRVIAIISTLKIVK